MLWHEPKGFYQLMPTYFWGGIARGRRSHGLRKAQGWWGDSDLTVSTQAHLWDPTLEMFCWHLS